ncbi:amidohydrolase family protein [Cupriavidus agavae]|uniref:Aminocarboxymuconate-semialdehyde decarboxylase n=1 Tax=Cupriavidus agavae TaxID=1001822 RepID=A0A4Q7RX88_9BURK|nr:amidohydrolase family protein [Cupriavidus agavae]RZT36842.1 aminocarboxymuconate-semialdehyde decarboxylase [Cupriavidus agavae]
MNAPFLHSGCGCLDVHTHVIPAEFPRYLGRRANVPWPSMRAAQPCHRHVVISEQIYRTVPHHSWDTGARLADMDATDVGHQVLSPMPELLSYWMEGDDAAVLSRYLNETLAGMVASAPTRFSALGAAPLQDVDRAIAELAHAVGTLGLAGVEVGSNVMGVPIGDARFWPFFEAAQALDAAIFVHPLRPAGMERLLGPSALEQVVAFPGEIGLAAASLMTGGLLARFPNLRIALSHGGGSIQALVPRMQFAWEKQGALRDAIALAPVEAARALYYDDLLYSPQAIRALVELVGDDRVMIGTDYPFAIMDADPAARIASLGLPGDVTERLRWKNAATWLGRI